MSTDIKNFLTNFTESEYNKLKEIINEYDDPEGLYYEAIGLSEQGINAQVIINDFEKGNFGFKTSFWAEYENKRKLNDERLSNPPEIREGENECPKCHQKKTLVVEMQTRSADEGYTYYIHCFNSKCMAITK